MGVSSAFFGLGLSGFFFYTLKSNSTSFVTWATNEF